MLIVIGILLFIILCVLSPEFEQLAFMFVLWLAKLAVGALGLAVIIGIGFAVTS